MVQLGCPGAFDHKLPDGEGFGHQMDALNQIREIGPLWRRRHEGPVRKLCLRLGASCPNRDGTLGRGGCIFCDAGDADPSLPPLSRQIQQGLRKIGEGPAIIAYLQDHTITHLPAQTLDRALEQVGTIPSLVEVALGTRPDCLPPEVVQVLCRHAASVRMMVELGLQTAHYRTLRFIRRQHSVACFAEAARLLHRHGLAVCAHVVLGLPTPGLGGLIRPEGPKRAIATARLLGSLPVTAVKIHNCHVLQRTPLARLYRSGRYQPPNREEYLQCLIPFLEHLPPDVEIHRLVGEARAPALLAPHFTAEKNRTLQWIRKELKRRKVVQGSRAG